MEYLAFVFGIFGLMAFLEASSLKKRVAALEESLTKTRGISFHEERQSLVTAAKDYIGQEVILGFKEDHGDVDVINYGNTKHGSNTILDVDEDWMLVRIGTPKGEKEKLIRMESVERIGVVDEGAP